jgi:curved DNA-binding protein CbpA
MISDLKYGLFKYDVKDYHAILGVPINAEAQAIRKRYLKIAYQLHPDTCTTSEPDNKSKASQILSKLVNPAYENLYKDKPRRECELILSEMGRRLSSDSYKITLVTDTAKKLYQEDKAREKLYYELIEKLAVDQYKDIDLIVKKIALMSELNMVYLMFLDETKSQPKKISQPPSVNTQSSSGIAQSDPNIYETQTDNANESMENGKSKSNEEAADSTTSKLAKLISNIKQNKEDGNTEQGILDARDALKLDPNNSTCHALIGSLYLEQGNITYAKIHIKKAYELNSADPEAKQAKEALEKLENKDKPKSSKGGAKSSSHKSSSSKDVKSKDHKSGAKPKDNKSKDNKSKDNKSKDNKAKDNKENDDDPKKNVPKIFGIYLW